MAIIDQRILIPARQEVVWAYVSDLFNNCQWQADCHAVSFLSTKHTGAGTRWRSTTNQGRDVVLEVTSWYNGLGYEYTYVDGGPFKENQGRVRLQEIPEGTVVQWTFSFEGGGLFGGGRIARQVDSTMAASLKALYKQVKAFSKDQNEALVAKSLMRDAPDVEARAAYKPRHPSSLTDGAPAEVVEDAVLLPIAAEPALKSEDAGLMAAIDLSAEPPVAVEDTRPREAIAAIPEGDERFAPKRELAEPAAPAPEPAPLAAAEPAPIDVPEKPETELIRPVPEIDRTKAAIAAAATAAALPAADNDGKSIWEVFGVRPPTAAEEAAASAEAAADAPALEESAEAVPVPAAALEAAPADVEPVAAPEIPAHVAEAVVEPSAQAHAENGSAPRVHQPRLGLRIVERRSKVVLRRPS
ncbi:MAG TPA: SRPBCC family protein [Candidatus Limnocylindrales bacterium]|nr:SRPBCC family protein [Candidatus Limnocylindrales bacterium]